MLRLLTDVASYLNGAIVAALAIFVIPRYLREKGTGTYIGFQEIALCYIYIAWALYCGLTIAPTFGLSMEALLRTLVSASIPFIAALAWVKLTDTMDWDKTRQTRK